MNILLLFLTFSMKNVFCRDFYMGMFKRNDFLVAQDSIYKGAMPYSYTYAKYGRLFKCPITYFRMVDRLGMGRGPTVEVVRGGLMKKYIVVRIKSPYNLPISVSIYVGCENKNKGPVWKRPKPVTPQQAETEIATAEIDGGSGEESDAALTPDNGTALSEEGAPNNDSNSAPGSDSASGSDSAAASDSTVDPNAGARRL